MILITGGAGFIGSAYVCHLNNQTISNIIICDRLGDKIKWLNLRGLNFHKIISPEALTEKIHNRNEEDVLLNKITIIIHLGAL